MYLYGFSGDKMRTNPRLYGIRTKEYPNMIGYCANIHRKGVEGQGMRVGTRGAGGANWPHIGVGRPPRGPPRVPFFVVPLNSSYFLLDMFLDKFLY